jgi:hypothetical protein
MKKHFYFCILFCLAVAAYSQELPRVGKNEAVQNETVNETVMEKTTLETVNQQTASDAVTHETTSESLSQEATPEPVMQEALPEIPSADTDEVQRVSDETPIEELIKGGLFKNKMLISQQAALLPEAQRLMLQERYSLGYVKPILFNSLLGFGIGNFINKDRAGGITHAVIDSLAVGTIVIAGSVYMGGVLTEILLLPIFVAAGQGGKETEALFSSIEQTMKISEIIVQVGLGVFLVNKLASIISVSVHTAKYNKTLKEALTPARPAVSVRALPIIAPNALGLALSINY